MIANLATIPSWRMYVFWIGIRCNCFQLQNFGEDRVREGGDLNVTFADKFLKTHKFLSLSKLSQTRREYVTTGHEMSTGFPRPPSSMPAGSGVRCFHDEGVRDRTKREGIACSSVGWSRPGTVRRIHPEPSHGRWHYPDRTRPRPVTCLRLTDTPSTAARP